MPPKYNDHEFAIMQTLKELSPVVPVVPLGTANTRDAGVLVEEDMKFAASKGMYIFVKKDEWKMGKALVSTYDASGHLYVWHRGDLAESKGALIETLDYDFRILRSLTMKPSEETEKRKKEISVLFSKRAVTNLEKVDFSTPSTLAVINLSFLQKGVTLEGKGGVFMPFHTIISKEVSYPMKSDVDNEEIRMLIPEQWVNYCGYDETFIKSYVSEVEKFVGIPIQYLGRGHAIKRFKKSENPDNNYLTDNSFYAFHFSGDYHFMLRYLAFNLLRFLYMFGYSNLPGLTMQLMKHFDSDNFFKCLCLAHASGYYDCYFGLGVTLADNGEILLPDPNQSVREYLDAVIKNKTISGVYSLKKLIISKEEMKKLEGLFAKKAYNDVLKIVSLLKPYDTPPPVEPLPYKRFFKGQQPGQLDKKVFIINPDEPGFVGKSSGISGSTGTSGSTGISEEVEGSGEKSKPVFSKEGLLKTLEKSIKKPQKKNNLFTRHSRDKGLYPSFEPSLTCYEQYKEIVLGKNYSKKQVKEEVDWLFPDVDPYKEKKETPPKEKF